MLSHEQEELEREELKKMLAEDKKIVILSIVLQVHMMVDYYSLLLLEWHPLP